MTSQTQQRQLSHSESPLVRVRLLCIGAALSLLAISCAAGPSASDAPSADASTSPGEVAADTPSALTAEAPRNDLFDDATVIDPTSLPFVESINTTGATSDNDDVSLGCPAPAADASVWYAITPTSDQRLLVGGVDPNYSLGISAATAVAGGLDLIECRPFSFVVEAEAGVTYYLQAFDAQDDGEGNGGNLTFSLQEIPEAPENDHFDDAIAIDPSSLPFTDSRNTAGATSDEVDFELGCPAPATDASVWYSITPTSDMRLSVSAEGSNFGWGVGVGTGVPGNFGEGECRPEPMIVDVEAGVTYHIHFFDGQEDGGGNGGMLELTVQELPAQ